jgi:chemosensory pili system protein ChpA (sensor histidine kinase/response regulator)
VAQCIDAWNRFSGGAAAALPQFHDRVRALAESIGRLGQADLTGLATRMVETADALRKAPLGHSDALALEMATALLLMDNALAGFQYLGEEFAGQAGIVGRRLTAAARGEPLAALDFPLLDEMSRQAREKLLLGQVAREIQANLAVIEQTLDAYFRDPGKAGELASLAKPIKQVEGALTVLGEPRAVDVLRECATAIDGFAGAGESQPSQPADFEDVAAKLSALGFFVDQLRHGPADIDVFLRPPAPMDVAEPTAETELREARRQARHLVDALREQPGDQALRGEIRQSLEVMRDHAELVDDAPWPVRRAPPSKPSNTKRPAAIEAIEEAVGSWRRRQPWRLRPKRSACRGQYRTDRRRTARIFIEEAHEVLAGIGGQLPQLESHRQDSEALVTVRRSFHTLKGSGRMVGLADFGDAAWAVEQVLNRWLQLEQEATPALLDMVRQAHRLFADWVAKLEAGDGVRHDASALIDACGQLAGEAAVPAMPTEPPPETEAPTPPAPPEPEPEPAPETPGAPVLRLVQPPPPEPEDSRIGELALSPTLPDLCRRGQAASGRPPARTGLRRFAAARHDPRRPHPGRHFRHHRRDPDQPRRPCARDGAQPARRGPGGAGRRPASADGARHRRPRRHDRRVAERMPQLEEALADQLRCTGGVTGTAGAAGGRDRAGRGSSGAPAGHAATGTPGGRTTTVASRRRTRSAVVADLPR